MDSVFKILFCFLFIVSCGDEENRPNIIYFLADDLGYGELGAFGQEIIETPHIDKLAKSGMIFSQHYSGSPVCAPSRSVLMTGQHSGHTHIRGNDEWKERGDVWNYEAVFKNPLLEGQRPLLDSIVTIAEILQSAGYKTGTVGKWGLGAPETDGIPNKQGFDFFYGYNCQRQAHTLYPMHLWKNKEKHLLENKMISPHSGLINGAHPKDPSSYKDFTLNDYAPELMHSEALRFIDRNNKVPFFLFYASPLPHVPLQAPQRWVEYYQKIFGEEEPYTGKSYFPNLTPRATYAAMISYLDEQVGDVVAKLQDLGIYKNTLIIFSSDNGPTYTGGADTPYFDSAKPFRSDKGWAKGYLHEGGIRVPMVASWQGNILPNSISDHLSGFYDVMPTICDILDIPTPDHTDGISFLPILLNNEQKKKHEYLYWEFPGYNGQQAVRLGKWKGIRKNIFEGNLIVELYDLNNDIMEQNNIASQYPEVIKRIEKIMKLEHIPSTLEQFKFVQLGDN